MHSGIAAVSCPVLRHRCCSARPPAADDLPHPTARPRRRSPARAAAIGRKAYALAGQSKDPLALKIVRWLDYSRGTADSTRFADIAAFIDQNPDWPSQKKMRRRAELASAGADDDAVADVVQAAPADQRLRQGARRRDRDQSRRGRGRHRRAAQGVDRGRFRPLRRARRARPPRRQAASRGPPGPARPAALGRPDRCRQAHAAAGLGRLPGACRSPPRPRRRFRQRRRKLVAKVPAALRNDPGWSSRRRAGGAKRTRSTPRPQMLLGISASAHPAAYWERAARPGPPADDFRQCRDGVSPGRAGWPSDDNDYSEAAVPRRLYRAALPQGAGARLRPFRPHHRPRDQSRRQGRGRRTGPAAPPASSGNADLAAKWYAVGAEHMATFYGQLAAHELGDDAPPKPMPEPRPTDTEQARFDAQEMVRAARLFFAAGDRARAMNFLMAMADQAKTADRFRDAGRACRSARPGRSGDRGGAARDRGRHAADGARLSGHDRAGSGRHRRAPADPRHRAAGERVFAPTPKARSGRAG